MQKEEPASDGGNGAISIWWKAPISRTPQNSASRYGDIMVGKEYGSTLLALLVETSTTYWSVVISQYRRSRR